MVDKYVMVYYSRNENKKGRKKGSNSIEIPVSRRWRWNGSKNFAEEVCFQRQVEPQYQHNF